MSRGKQVFARGGAINDRFRFSRDASGCEREQVLGGEERRAQSEPVCPN